VVGIARGFVGWGVAVAGIVPALWFWFGEKRLNAASRVIGVAAGSR
jgi:hypothetical protein